MTLNTIITIIFRFTRNRNGTYVFSPAMNPCWYTSYFLKMLFTTIETNTSNKVNETEISRQQSSVHFAALRLTTMRHSGKMTSDMKAKLCHLILPWRKNSSFLFFFFFFFHLGWGLFYVYRDQTEDSITVRRRSISFITDDNNVLSHVQQSYEA